MISFFNSTSIPIMISAIALLVAILTYIQSVRVRKRDEHEKAWRHSMNLCDQAYEKLFFDTWQSKPSAESFNKFVAVNIVLDKNLLELDPSTLEELVAEFEPIKEDYERVSGERFGFHERDLDITGEIYAIHDVPPRLDAFYKKICNKTIARHHALQKEHDD